MPNLIREPPETKDIEEYLKSEIAIHTIDLRERLVKFLIPAYSTAIGATLCIIFFQGFNLWGFKLAPNFIKWIGAATVGEVAGLLAIVVVSVFPKK